MERKSCFTATMNLPSPLSRDLFHGALAYLDPGSGALLLQMLLAGIAGVALFLKYQGRRLLTFFGLGRKDDDSSSGDDK